MPFNGRPVFHKAEETGRIFYLIAVSYDRLQEDDDDVVTVLVLSATNGRQNEENNRTAESLLPEHRKEK